MKILVDGVIDYRLNIFGVNGVELQLPTRNDLQEFVFKYAKDDDELRYLQLDLMTHLSQFTQKAVIPITKKNEHYMVDTSTKQVFYCNDDLYYHSGPFYFIFMKSFWKPPAIPRRKPCPPSLPKKGGKQSSTFKQPEEEAITVGADVASVGKATQSEVQAKCVKTYASKTTVLQWGEEFSSFYKSKRPVSNNAKKTEVSRGFPHTVSQLISRHDNVLKEKEILNGPHGSIAKSTFEYIDSLEDLLMSFVDRFKEAKKEKVKPKKEEKNNDMVVHNNKYRKTKTYFGEF